MTMIKDYEQCTALHIPEDNEYMAVLTENYTKKYLRQCFIPVLCIV